jgi:hypothetical protein
LAAGTSLTSGGAFWTHPRSIGVYERGPTPAATSWCCFTTVIPLAFPKFASSRVRTAFERMLRLPARAIAISEQTKRQLEEARRAASAPAHLPPPAVVSLPHEFSAAPRNHAPSEPPTLRTAMLDRMGSFALCVGTVEIRKNHARLLKLRESLGRQG